MGVVFFPASQRVNKGRIMANNDTRTVEDVEINHVDPSPDSPDDEFLPLAPLNGTSPQTEPAPATSPAEPKPGDQPAAPAEPAPKEPAAPAPAEPAKPAEPAVAAPAEAKAPVEEDVSAYAKELQNLSTEYKKLPSESVREYAMRLEVINTRRKLNSQKAKDLLGGEGNEPKTPAQPVAPAAVTPPEGMDPEELTEFQQKARAAGFVPAAEVQAATAKKSAEDAFNTWINEHPEYDQVHDPEGTLFKRVTEFWNSGLYSTDPTKMKDPFKQTKTILDKIHADVFDIKPTSELSTVKAQQENIKVASHTGTSPGGGSSAPEDKAKTAKVALLSRGLKGFTEEEIAELAKED
jgi:hypothetical protein